MKKRVLLLLIAVALILCACQKGHTHEFSDTYSSDDAYHWLVCACGEKDGYEQHIWNNGAVSLRPTVESEVEMTFTCKVCRFQRTEKIDKLDPDHVHVFDVLNSDAQDHWYECVCGEQGEKAAHSWDGGTVIKEATQTEKGEKRFTCTVCEWTRTEEIPSLHVHTFADAWSADKTHHWHSATCSHTSEVADKAAHSWDEGTVTKPATETATGVRKYTCTVCGYGLEVEIPAVAAKGLSFSAGTLHKLDKALSALPLTVEAEVYLPKTYTQRPGVIFGNYAGSGKNFSFEIQTGGVPRLFYTDTKGKDQSILFNKVDIRTGDWAHIAVSFDFTNKTISLYLNGELKETVACSTDMLPAITDMNFVLGGDNRSGNAQYFKGQIRSVAAYSTVRTAAQIKKDYESGINFFDKELLLYYALNEKSASKDITDLSPNGYHIFAEWFSDEKVELDYAYSFAVVGDTQVLCQKYPEKMEAIYDWIIANKDNKKIAHVFGLGDITEEWGNNKSEAEWIRAQKYISKLDGVLP